MDDLRKGQAPGWPPRQGWVSAPKLVLLTLLGLVSSPFGWPALGWAGEPERRGTLTKAGDQLVMCPRNSREGPVVAMFPEAGRFRRAISQAGAAAARGGGGPVTGLIVPHHLLAVDLIARGFQAVAGNRFRRIVVLCPDHFRRSRTPFAVGLRDFSSCLGPVPTDVRAVRWLAAHSLVSVSNLFSHEHAVQALLPFLAHHFPGTPVVCVAIRATAGPAEWERLARLLGPLCGPGTLVVQSTDFSHGLPAAAAAAHDREAAAAVLSGDPARAAGLHQPRHIDCRGALYLQMRLQAARGAVPTIIAAGNAQQYAPPPLADVTSYLVAAFRVPEPSPVTGR